MCWIASCRISAAPVGGDHRSFDRMESWVHDMAWRWRMQVLTIRVAVDTLLESAVVGMLAAGVGDSVCEQPGYGTRQKWQ